MKFLIYASALCLLAACGPTRISGTRPGGTQAQFSNDLLECRAMSQRVFQYEDKSAVVQCMEGKQWTITFS